MSWRAVVSGASIASAAVPTVEELVAAAELFAAADGLRYGSRLRETGLIDMFFV